MTKKTKKRIIDYSLSDLGIKERNIVNEVTDINEKVYNFYLLNCATGASVKMKGKKVKSDEKTRKEFKKYLESLNLELHVYENNEKVIIDVKKSGIYVYNCFGVCTFLRFIRNAIAHGNILKYKEKIIFFDLEHSSTSLKIDKVLTDKIRFLAIINSVKILETIAEKVKVYIINK